MFFVYYKISRLAVQGSGLLIKRFYASGWFVRMENDKYTSNTYLLLAECEVRTASYGPSVFLPFMAQARSAPAMKTRKEKNEDPQLAVQTEQTRLKRCLLYGFVDYSSFEKVIES